MACKESYDLVQFIASRIPDFYALVEQSRVERRPLKLARAIEDEFGEGSFSTLTTAFMQDSEKLLEQLR